MCCCLNLLNDSRSRNATDASTVAITNNMLSYFFFIYLLAYLLIYLFIIIPVIFVNCFCLIFVSWLQVSYIAIFYMQLSCMQLV